MEEVTAGTRRALSIAAFALMAMAVASSLEPAAANKDGNVLAALRKGLKDPDGMLTNWDPSLVNPCTWFHVTCDGDNRVTRLDLGRLNLSGPLATELGQLEKLQYMEIYGNNINGPIPSEFGHLANLISLDLSSNSISGVIPAALGNAKSLTFLRLGHNRLTGPIPRELAGLPNLGIADFSNNDLCGTIPTGGAFQKISPSSFDNNPRLHQGVEYQPSC